MLEDKIKQLLGYGFSIEKITGYCLQLYNSNFYEIDNFQKWDFNKMKRYVKFVICFNGCMNNLTTCD